MSYEKTNKLFDVWERCTRDVANTKKRLERDELECLDAREALGNWLSPTDVKDGETFNIWIGSKLVHVKYFKNGKGVYRYEISIRANEARPGDVPTPPEASRPVCICFQDERVPGCPVHKGRRR